MTNYAVQHKANGQYLKLKHNHIIIWSPYIQQAQLWGSVEEATQAGMFAFSYPDDSKFDVVELASVLTGKIINE